MLHICANGKQMYTKIIFTSSLLGNGGLGACFQKIFLRKHPLEYWKKPFAEWNIAAFIIDLGAKIGKTGFST